MKVTSLLAILVVCAVSTSIAMSQTGSAPMAPGRAVASDADKARLAKYEKDFVAAKAKLAKKPKDKTAIKNFSTLGALFGHESMMSPVLPARIKYKQALRIYREVLKVDPKNPVAKQDSDMIISIYKQMGRPIPKD